MPSLALLSWAEPQPHNWGSFTRKERAARNPYSTFISMPLKQKNPPKIMQKQTQLSCVFAGKKDRDIGNGKIGWKAGGLVKIFKFTRLQVHPWSWLLQSPEIWRPGFNYTGLFTHFFLCLPFCCPGAQMSYYPYQQIKKPLCRNTYLCNTSDDT